MRGRLVLALIFFVLAAIYLDARAAGLGVRARLLLDAMLLVGLAYLIQSKRH